MAQTASRKSDNDISVDLDHSAFYDAATVSCGVDSFKTTGIWPWNPDVFTEADFMASTVTERNNTENVAMEIDSGDITAQAPINTSVESMTGGSSQTRDLVSLDDVDDCILQTPEASSAESMTTSANKTTSISTMEGMAGSSALSLAGSSTELWNRNK